MTPNAMTYALSCRLWNDARNKELMRNVRGCQESHCENCNSKIIITPAAREFARRNKPHTHLCFLCWAQAHQGKAALIPTKFLTDHRIKAKRIAEETWEDPEEMDEPITMLDAVTTG